MNLFATDIDDQTHELSPIVGLTNYGIAFNLPAGGADVQGLFDGAVVGERSVVVVEGVLTAVTLQPRAVE